MHPGLRKKTIGSLGKNVQVWFELIRRKVELDFRKSRMDFRIYFFLGGFWTDPIVFFRILHKRRYPVTKSEPKISNIHDGS